MKPRASLIQKLQDELEKFYEAQDRVFEVLNKFENFEKDKECNCSIEESQELGYTSFAYPDENYTALVCANCGGWITV